MKTMLMIITSLLVTTPLFAKEAIRIPQLKNQQVAVWKTVIYPTKQSILKMHRHDKDRVIVALTDGILKVTNQAGQSHLMKLRKGQAYYFAKDPKNEQHTDLNISNNTIKVMVIEIQNS